MKEIKGSFEELGKLATAARRGSMIELIGAVIIGLTVGALLVR